MTTSSLNRDRLTWLLCLMLAALAYQQGILGPLMPLLRDSLGMSYTQGGALFAAIALGMILTGLVSERVAQRVGRRAVLWGGAIGCVIGVVAFERCFMVWGAHYLADVVGLEPALASALMGVFLAGMVIGRMAGSWLTRRWPASLVLPAAVVVALVGFPLFWAAPTPVLAVVGLFIAGLGVANLFPLTIGIAAGQAAGMTNAATARVSLAVGVAIFSAPLAPGGLADRFSLRTAFAIVPVLGLATLGLLGFAYRKGWR